MPWINTIKNAEHHGEKVFEDIASHHLPVIVYGASEFAAYISNSLKRNGIDIYGYTIDAKYIRNNSFCGKPVFVWEEIKKQSEAYVFVLGTCVRRKMIKRFLAESTINSYCISSPDGELGRISYNYVMTHRNAFHETYLWLSDDLSQKTFCAYLNLKISGNIAYVLDVSVPLNKQYFNKLSEPFRGGVFVDCGAYDGDTVQQYIQWSGGKYKKIYAFEPDAGNRTRMEGRVAEQGWAHVEILPYGVWDIPSVQKFSEGGQLSSSVSQDGLLDIQTTTIDNILEGFHGDAPLFIKMDIEGSELRALKGAYHTIATHFPALAICVYHREDDLITIPQYIKSFENEDRRYQIYLRKHLMTTTTDLVLYAIPTRIQ